MLGQLYYSMIGNIKVKKVDMWFVILMGYDLDTDTINDINDIINRINKLKIN